MGSRDTEEFRKALRDISQHIHRFHGTGFSIKKSELRLLDQWDFIRPLHRRTLGLKLIHTVLKAPKHTPMRSSTGFHERVAELDCPFDRVRCAEWCRKLNSLSDDDLECCKIKNEYAQLLRIQVRNKCIHGPFEEPPAEKALCPLSEALGTILCEEVPFLPKMGPINPVLYHKSPDGRAYVSAKQIPGGGVLCYMAVSPDGLNI